MQVRVHGVDGGPAACGVDGGQDGLEQRVVLGVIGARVVPLPRGGNVTGEGAVRLVERAGAAVVCRVPAAAVVQLLQSGGAVQGLQFGVPAHVPELGRKYLVGRQAAAGGVAGQHRNLDLRRIHSLFGQDPQCLGAGLSLVRPEGDVVLK